MRRRVMMVLAGAALASSLLASDAEARGGGGHGGGGHGGGVGHVGSFGAAHVGARTGAHMGGFGRTRVGRIGGGNVAGIRRARTIDFSAGFGPGAYTRHSSGIHRSHFNNLSVFVSPAFAQTATPDDCAGACVPAAASGSGGMAPAASGAAPSDAQNQTAPAFRTGDRVRLRSGGPLMTVKDITDGQANCFWSDGSGQINADSFPVGVLQMG
jgi:uncharacterized protein YodC (DUF2158 family)